MLSFWFDFENKIADKKHFYGYSAPIFFYIHVAVSGKQLLSFHLACRMQKMAWREFNWSTLLAIEM